MKKISSLINKINLFEKIATTSVRNTFAKYVVAQSSPAQEEELKGLVDKIKPVMRQMGASTFNLSVLFGKSGVDLNKLSDASDEIFDAIQAARQRGEVTFADVPAQLSKVKTKFDEIAKQIAPSMFRPTSGIYSSQTTNSSETDTEDSDAPKLGLYPMLGSDIMTAKRRHKTLSNYGIMKGYVSPVSINVTGYINPPTRKLMDKVKEKDNLSSDQQLYSFLDNRFKEEKATKDAESVYDEIDEGLSEMADKKFEPVGTTSTERVLSPGIF